MAYKYKLVQEISKDPFDIENIKQTDLDAKANRKQDEKNRAKGNTYMTDKERNMTPEEYREYREREKLKEQGRKNLTQEVLRRLKNR